MNNITFRQFRILSDCPAVYRFMTDIYEHDRRNGVPAPFFEYALSSVWMDKTHIHRCRLWFDADKIVAFCFFENPESDYYFSLRPGYEQLADELVGYATKYAARLILYGGQAALLDAARRAGYAETHRHTEFGFDLSGSLDYALPDSVSFVPAQEITPEKATECCWRGFDHESEDGPWDGDSESTYALLAAPHSTPQYSLAAANERGDYVCWAGMWWTPENRLAYLEPLCTVPEYRGRGVGAAVLSELARRMRALGAEHMTGGGSPFYPKIGFTPAFELAVLEKR